MPRVQAAPDHRLLVDVLRHPDHLRGLTATELSRLIDVAHYARLLGWLMDQLDASGADRDVPEWLADRLLTARAMARELDRSLSWEIDRLKRAFLGVDLPWVLLKGAAYHAAALPPGRGRQVADIDLLVPETGLGRAEQALRDQGWEFAELDPYDERFYREWMHELPPMMNIDRHSIVDVHHAILPRTSRLHPPSARLFERAVDAGGARTLCPSHMVLHAAAHLFHDGEIAGAIRDLVDLDRLLRHFAAGPFWADLVAEAQALGLQRPAYYAIRYARRTFNTPIPDSVQAAFEAFAPPAVIRRFMDQLVEEAVMGASGPTASTAAFALYVRSHWLRMPPLLLVRHLTRKARRT